MAPLGGPQRGSESKNGQVLCSRPTIEQRLLAEVDPRREIVLLRRGGPSAAVGAAAARAAAPQCGAVYLQAQLDRPITDRITGWHYFGISRVGRLALLALLMSTNVHALHPWPGGPSSAKGQRCGSERHPRAAPGALVRLAPISGFARSFRFTGLADSAIWTDAS